MVTRKGNVRCDECNAKRGRSDLSFLTLTDESIDTVLHFCSWKCLFEGAIGAMVETMTPADFI